MSKSNGTPTLEQQLAEIERTARVLAKVLPMLSTEERAQTEKRITAAYSAIRRPTWKWFIVQREIVWAIDDAAKFLQRGIWSEERAVNYAARHIADVMDAEDAPQECHGRRPNKGTVAAALRTWRQRHGSTDGSKYTAMIVLWRELGISGGTESAVMQLVKRHGASRRR